jgi:hypothetical protein
MIEVMPRTVALVVVAKPGGKDAARTRTLEARATCSAAILAAG